jgi:CHAT domain-containing protein/tetratricopeptide (TPR) repeat protein
MSFGLTRRALLIALLLAPAFATAPARAEATEGFSGAWRTTYGRLVLVEDDTGVVGRYPNEGTLHGERTEDRLSFDYEDSFGSGSGEFLVSPDAQSFSGWWRAEGRTETGIWSGIRADSTTESSAAEDDAARFAAMEDDFDRQRHAVGATAGLALSYVILGDGRFDYFSDEAGALDDYEQALEIYREVHGETHADIAFALDRIGRVHRILARYALAHEFFLRALEMRRSTLGETHAFVAKSHQSLGLVARAQGNPGLALGHYRRGLAISLAVGDETGLAAATAYNNIASVKEDLGQYGAALENLLKALAIIERLPGDTRLDVATVQNNLGHLRRARGEFSRSRDHYLKALALFQDLYGPRASTVADVLDALGLLDADAGDYISARTLAHAALEIREAALPANHLDIAYSHNNIAFIAHYLKEFDTALAHYKAGLGILRRVHGDTHSEIASVYNNIGTIHHDRGDTRSAEEYYRKALVVRQRAFGETHPHVSTSYNNLAMLALSTRDLAAAEDGFRRSLAIRRVALGERHPDIAAIHHNLSEVYRLRGDTPAWLDEVRAAVEASRLLPEPWDGRGATLRPTPSSVWFLYILSWAEATDTRIPSREALVRAILTMDTALELLARLRAEISKESRLLHERRLKDLPAWALALRCDLEALGGGGTTSHPDAAGALRAVEIASAWSFLEMMAEARVEDIGSPPAHLASEERDLTDRIRVLDGHAGDSDADRERIEVGEAFESLVTRLHREAPRYAGLKYPRPVSLDALQDALTESEAAVSYVVSPEGSFAVAVTSESCVLVRLGDQASMESAVHAARGALTTMSRSDTRGITALAALDHRLLGPLESLVSGRRLIIVPGSALEGIAFGALRTPEGGSRIDDHEIVMAPSLAVFALLRAGRETGAATHDKSARDNRLLALGNPAYDGRPDLSASRAMQRYGTERGTWGPLPASGAEVRAISAFFPRDSRLVLTGTNAAEGRLDAESWARFGYLHFACHGALEEGPGREPALVLSLTGNQAPADGFLTLSEVARERIDARLVVLSACNSGRSGSQRPPTGVSSLARAFLLAGADAVVVSLWPVGDEAAARLMVEFYRRMRREGTPPAAALRQAAIALRTRMPSPVAWAPFVMLGP